MSTNLVALRTIDEFMADYKPVYQPIYSLFLGKSRAYPSEVGTVDFKRMNAIGDIRAKHITPKDTEIKQFGASESSKSYKRYFLANQFTISALQDRRGVEDVIAQVLDEHQKQADDMLLLGEGTSNSTMINNGLFWSADTNYRLESSEQINKGVAEDHLKALHTQIMSSVAVADQIAGRKLILFYGSDMSAKFGSLYANTDQPFRGVLDQVLGSEYSVAALPSAVTPSSTNGFILINLDQVLLHYSMLPQLKAQGVNDEKMYAWFNFMQASMMLEVLSDDAIIRQPVTFEA